MTPAAAKPVAVGPGEAGLELSDSTAADATSKALVLRAAAEARADRLDRLVVFVASADTATKLSERLGLRRLPWRDHPASAGGGSLLALVLDLAPVVVRPATPAELDRAGELTLAGYVADDLLHPGDDYGDQLTDAAGRATAATLLVAVDPTAGVIGTVTFCRPGSPYAELSRPGEAEFRMLAVDPAARGSGVGAALVHACLDRAGASGDSGIVLSTLAKMQAAARLYQRLGFTADPDRDWSPGPGIDLLAYQRRIVIR